MYVCFVLNNAFSEVIQSTPLRQAYGTDNNISPMLYFSFYKPAYYLVDETTFPSESKELRGRWVGVSENVGHFMTYKILTDDTHRIIHHSNICSAADPNARNLRLDPLIKGAFFQIKMTPNQIIMTAYEEDAFLIIFLRFDSNSLTRIKSANLG
jgi:hypothetical protein